MMELLDRLPQRQRAAIVLRYYEDLSEAQTAAALGCRQGTIKSLVSRGLSTLREQLEDAPIEAVDVAEPA
jgi:RNA polymerase sigma factor (sigma-70 family)